MYGRTSAPYLTLAFSLALLSAPAGYTRQGGPPQDAPPGKAGRKAERGDPQGRGGERRADPCDHEPPGHAYGRDKLCPPEGASGGVARGDFNFDGFGDLAIGVPDEDIGKLRDAGAVHVIYGSGAGLSAAAGPSDQFWTAGAIDAARFAPQSTVTGIRFGTGLASGDFNGDGFSDLAVGAPGDSVDGVTRAGRVLVLYGSASGLRATGSQVLRQGRGGLTDAPEAGDEFGSVLNWGDFNRDGYGDLAVGVPDEDIGSVLNAGAVHVIYGSAAGLTDAGDRLWRQGADGIGNTAEEGDFFGTALAAGDFNGDGPHDLAIGVPKEEASIIDNNSGGVHVIYGSPSEGLTSSNNQVWFQNQTGIHDENEPDDDFGRALAAGNFNGGAHDDLAVGVPGEDVGSIVNAGAVNVIYGSAAGLTEAGDQFWTQDSPGVPDAAEQDDFFGRALAAGDLNGDGLKDLAIGVIFEDLGTNSNAGGVNIVFGSTAGLYARLFPSGTAGAPPEPPGAVFARFLDQGAATGGLNPPEDGDFFGRALSAWDFGFQPGVADLAIGAPGEDVGDIQDAGAVAVIYGLATPGQDHASLANPQHWTQDSEGIEDQAEAGDGFGRALY